MPADEPKRDEELLRRFTLLGMWSLVFNGILGAGIFGTPAKVAAHTGVFSPLLFAACGVLMLPIVLSFAEVASYFRATGGPILYVSTAFGALPAFLTGWAMYVSRATAFAANANLLVDSLGWLANGLSSGASRIALLVALTGGLTAINVAGSNHAMRAAGVFTALKIVPLLVLAVAGASVLSADAFPLASTPLPSMESTGAAILIAIYAFVGWEVALVPAGEARDPTRDVPRALVLGLVTIAGLYVWIQCVCVAALPDLARSERPLVDAAGVVLGRFGAVLLLCGAVASIGGNLAVSVIAGSRTTYALARAGSLPAWFGRVHPRFRTPAVSVVVYGVVVAALATSGTFIWLAGLSVLARLFVFVLVLASLPRLRARCGSARGAARLPGGYAIPLVALCVCAFLAWQVTLASALTTLGFLAVGALLFLLARGRGARSVC